MQRATAVNVAAAITVMVGAALMVLAVHVLMLHVHIGGMRKGVRTRQRRGHDTRELRNKKQCGQDANKTTYGPKPLHQPFMHRNSKVTIREVCGDCG